MCNRNNKQIKKAKTILSTYGRTIKKRNISVPGFAKDIERYEKREYRGQCIDATINKNLLKICKGWRLLLI